MRRSRHRRAFVETFRKRLLIAAMLCAAVFAFGSPAAPIGQPLDQLRFSQIEESEDFTSIAVVSLAQDALGFIWVGTRNGLLRYDGVAFKEYRTQPDDPASLAGNAIVDLHLDRTGQLWIASDKGISRYDLERDRFENFAMGSDAALVRGFAEDASGRLFAASEAGLAYAFDRRENAFRPLGEPRQMVVKSIAVDGNGCVWLGGFEGLICLESDGSLRESVPLPPDIARSSESFVSAIDIAPNGEVLYGAYGYGVWSYDPATGQHRRYTDANERDRIIGALIVDEEGNTLIGSTAGLIVAPADGSPAIRYAHSEYDSTSIQDGTIYALLVDAQGNLWTGSSRGGLAVAANRKRFASIRHAAYDPLSLTKDKVTAILVDTQDRLWVGYHNDGIDMIADRGRRKTYYDPYRDDPNGLGKGTIFDLHEDPDGAIWIASNWSGLQKLDPATGEVTRYLPDPANPTSIGGSDVRRIEPDRNGDFWLALNGAGVEHFDTSTGAFTSLVGFPHRWTEDIALDSKGGLWVASSDGLSYLPARSSAFKEFAVRVGDGPGLSAAHARCLCIDSEGFIWIGTAEGLDRLDPRDESWARFGRSEGLPSQTIRSLVEDDAGRLWVGTARGLAVFDPAAQRFQAFDKTDGLASNEMVDRAALKAPDGGLYFGSERGIAHFRPEAIKRNLTPPPVVVTGVKLFSTPLQISNTPGAILPESPLTVRKIVFPPGKNSFTFEFAALNFIAPESNEYAYRLEGFDSEWIRNGHRRDCSYTNIGPGEYTFRVKASNNDGVWNEEGHAVAIVVLPHYWQTLWFQGLMVLLAAIGAAVAYRLRIGNLARQKALLEETVIDRTLILQQALDEVEEQKRHIQDQNLELQDHRENLEELVAQRTAELEAARVKAEVSERLKSSFLENVTHEIRTPMNAIIGFLNILRHKSVTASESAEYHAIIERSGKALLQLIDDILDLSRMETEGLSLNRERVNVSEMFEALETYYCEVAAAERPEISIIWEHDGDTPFPLAVVSDEVRLQQIVNNLLDNALKFTERGSIRFGYKLIESDEAAGAKLEIRVSDTGVGIPADKIGQIFDRFRKIEGNRQKLYRGTGLGLAIARRLVDQMGGAIHVESRVGIGSVFLVTLPAILED